MKKGILYIILFLFCINVHGQRNCGSELNLTKLQQTDPARYQRIMDLENRIQKFLSEPELRSTSQPTIYIPVVVHIVYKTNDQNISDAQVQSQIQVLNEDFRRLNADKTKTPSSFASVAGDANIEFVLAKKDPYGKSSTGITRTFTTQNQFYPNDDVKFRSRGGENGWNPYRYLNIWVCNLSGLDDKKLLGYTQFPSDLFTSPETDGVVICYKYFGRDGSAASPFNKGRTATHEVGHWLNLRHIWGDDGDTGCHCDGSDEVIDTPNQSVATEGCPSFPKTDCCSIFSPGIMFMNYMDYSNDECMNMFTNGQIARMRAVLYGERGEMLAYSHCHNGIKDDNETGIDCGGSCTPCDKIPETCNDGILNQNETGIDCGGVCPPCGIGGKLNDILTQTHCLCGDSPIPEENTASMFSGENLINSEAVKVAFGQYSCGFIVRDYNRCGKEETTERSAHLNGGIFFEEEGVLFTPDKFYKITFNYWYRSYASPLHLGGYPIGFKLANGLTDTGIKSIYEYNFGKGKTYNFVSPAQHTFTPNIPNSFEIGYVIQKRYGVSCYDQNGYHMYCENSFTFQPDNTYKQLLVFGTAPGFNVLKIEEMCFDNYVFNEHTFPTSDQTRASNSIQFQNFTYEPSNSVEFVAGDKIILRDNVRIAPQGQGSVHLRIDKNMCPNNTSPLLRSPIETPSITSVKEIQFSQLDEIKIYPNPTTGIVNIIVSGNESQIKTVSVCDLSGKILENELDFRENTLNLSNLNNGIYFLKIQTSLGKTIHKVIIKK